VTYFLFVIFYFLFSILVSLSLLEQLSGKEAVRAVKSGAISAVIAQYPANMGKQAVEAAIKAIQGESVAKVIDTGTALVTKENADEFLK